MSKDTSTKRKSFKTVLYENSLTITFMVMFIASLFAQAFYGWKDHNEFLKEKGVASIEISEYLHSGHFIQATFENWESEFLQMGLFIILSIWLRQKGSSESKPMEGDEEVEREPKASPDAPWPVKKGGWFLKIYKHSLSIAFILLFLVSFWLHLYGSLKNYNTEQRLENKSTVSMGEYVGMPKFWFESFQNWQSEFLSVAAIVFLSIYLRQKGSAQSKPVDAPNDENE